MEVSDNNDSNKEEEEIEKEQPVPGCSQEDNNSNDGAKAIKETNENTDNPACEKENDVTDLRPTSDSSDCEDEASAVFKKRKLSNSRNYRQNNKNEEEDGVSNDELLNEEEHSAVPDQDYSAEDSNDPVLDDDEPVPDNDDDADAHSNGSTSSGESEPVRVRGVDNGAVSKTTDTLMNKEPQVFPHVKFSHFLKDHHSIQLGYGHRLRPSFCQRQISSLENVRKLHCVKKLEGHEGCVNSLSFNMSGTRIASGSDDLSVIVWDWQHGKKLLQYNTGHRANVFQSKMMPGDLLISSCSRDGQVRLAELSTNGSIRSTKRLAQHKGPAHKMSLIPGTATGTGLLSAGEDGQVFMIDIREIKPDKILLLKNGQDRKIPIYSIHSNPVDGNLFCTTGRDQFIRVFDRRFIGPGVGTELHKLCPEHLTDAHELKAYITCAVFNHNGSQVLGSYNDEDIYLFEPENTERDDRVTTMFRGHRNNATVKGVNFYGPESEYVVSGSDCGNIFIWERESAALVRMAHGDMGGVVNVLEPHPNLPVLATSGLDDDVKIWQPGPEFDEVENVKQKEYMRETISK